MEQKVIISLDTDTQMQFFLSDTVYFGNIIWVDS